MDKLSNSQDGAQVGRAALLATVHYTGQLDVMPLRMRWFRDSLYKTTSLQLAIDLFSQP
jgi:hypothetical protein